RRGEILFRAAEILVRRKEELARDMTREMGKVLPETRGDVQEAIDMTYYMAGEGRRQFGRTTPSELKDKFQMSGRMPVGVAGLITPWNFPMAIPSWKMMPALIVGNTVVIKPASDTPLSVVNLVRALDEAGLPKGVVNMVTGGGTHVGAPLMGHKDVHIVSFTGSTEVGRKVSEACAPAFKHCHLEMGPCVNESQRATVEKYVKIGRDEGATLLAGGHRLDQGPYAKGWFHEATLFGDVDPRMRIAREEIFGPVVSVIPVDSLDQAIEV